MDLLVKGDVGLLGTQRYGGSRLTYHTPERTSLIADKMGRSKRINMIAQPLSIKKTGEKRMKPEENKCPVCGCPGGPHEKIISSRGVPWLCDQRCAFDWVHLWV